jgi:hypothetical protein
MSPINKTQIIETVVIKEPTIKVVNESFDIKEEVLIIKPTILKNQSSIQIIET